MTTPILQFGTSRFLQAHADLFLSEARDAGQPVGPVAVVQSSGSAERAGRVAAFNDPAGFPVVIRGLESGVPVERVVRVTSVARGLSTATDWPEILRVARDEASIIISNTADSGYSQDLAGRIDVSRDPEVAPGSFPEKLLALLASRCRAGGSGVTMFPCELLERNGDTLKALIFDLARRSGAGERLLTFLACDCLWANSLVDRIVSAPIDPLGAVAEPYALWAIERQPGLMPPCDHVAIRMVDDLQPVAALKLFLLNLGHTVLAEWWSEAERDPATTVRAMLADPVVKRDLLALYETELVPGFALRGMESEARRYIAVTIERFENPFLDHRLTDIIGNHAQKVERRLAAYLTWTAAIGQHRPILESIAARHGFSNPPNRQDQSA